MCEACDSEQLAAMRYGRRAVALAMIAPLSLVVLAAVVAPFESPLAIATAGFVGLLGARLVVAWIRRKRAERSRLLFVDGVGDVLLGDGGVAGCIAVVALAGGVFAGGMEAAGCIGASACIDGSSSIAALPSPPAVFSPGLGSPEPG